jgi:hypothetical protein
VLVLGPRHIIPTIHVSPVNIFREVYSLVKIPSMGYVLPVATNKGSLLNTASVGSLGEEGLFGLSVSSLGELINGIIVQGIVPFGISCVMADALSPGIFRSGPSAVGLDIDVVDTTANAEEAIFSPVRTPVITNAPVLLAILSDTVTNDGNIVSNPLVTSFVTENTASII